MDFDAPTLGGAVKVVFLPHLHDVGEERNSNFWSKIKYRQYQPAQKN